MARAQETGSAYSNALLRYCVNISLSSNVSLCFAAHGVFENPCGEIRFEGKDRKLKQGSKTRRTVGQLLHYNVKTPIDQNSARALDSSRVYES